MEAKTAEEANVNIRPDIASGFERFGLDASLFIKPILASSSNGRSEAARLNEVLSDALSTIQGRGLKSHEQPMGRFKFADLFAGIGGFRIALENLGGSCVGFSEIDNKAISTYEANFNTQEERALGDIREIERLPDDPDIVVGGVPCQSWSIAGKNRGFEDTRGALWGDTVRVVSETMPSAFIFENVKGLADPRHEEELRFLMNSFREAGYHVTHAKLNAINFGHPQSRVRTFIVGMRSREAFRRFSMPKKNGRSTELYEVLDGIPQSVLAYQPREEQGNLFSESSRSGSSNGRVSGSVNDYFIFNDVRNGQTTIHSWDLEECSNLEEELCSALLENRRSSQYGPKDGNPLSPEDLFDLVPEATPEVIQSLMEKGIFREREPGKYDFANSRISSGLNGIYRIFMPHAPNFSTLTASGSNDYIAKYSVGGETIEQYKKNFVRDIYRPEHYRSLSKREWARLQGFPDDFELNDSDSAAKKQLGNAVPVLVVQSVATALIESGVLDPEN